MFTRLCPSRRLLSHHPCSRCEPGICNSSGHSMSNPPPSPRSLSSQEERNECDCRQCPDVTVRTGRSHAPHHRTGPERRLGYCPGLDSFRHIDLPGSGLLPDKPVVRPPGPATNSENILVSRIFGPASVSRRGLGSLPRSYRIEARQFSGELSAKSALR
jgi:hypothetical protein